MVDYLVKNSVFLMVAMMVMMKVGHLEIAKVGMLVV
jgi:hypothetical protein